MRFFDIPSKLVALYSAFVYYLKKMLDARIWDTLEDEMKEWLEFYRGIHGQNLSENLFDPKMLERDGEVLKCNKKFMEKYHNYSEVMYKVLLSAVEDMLSNRGLNIFSFLIHEGFEQQTAAGNLGYEQRHEYYENKREELGACIHLIMGGNMEDSQIFSVGNVLERIFYFLKECYADLICILTLELSFQEYLSTVVESISDAKMEIDELMDTELVARIALVMAAMSDKDGLDYERDYVWTNNEFENCEEWPKPVQELKKYGYLFGYAYLQSRVKISEIDMIQNERNIIYDNKVLSEILKYLHTCRQRFYKTGKEEGRHNVKRICSLVNENENKNCFAQMMQLLKDYEADIYKDIERIL